MKIELNTKMLLLAIGLALVALGAMVLVGHAWGKRSVVKEYITSPTVVGWLPGDSVLVDRWHTKYEALPFDTTEFARQLDSAMDAWENCAKFMSNILQPYEVSAYTGRQTKWLVSDDKLDSLLLTFGADLVKSEIYPLERKASLTVEYDDINAQWKRKRLPDEFGRDYWLSWYLDFSFSYYLIQPSPEPIPYMIDVDGYWYKGQVTPLFPRREKIDMDLGIRVKFTNLILKPGLNLEMRDNKVHPLIKVGLGYEGGIL